LPLCPRGPRSGPGYAVPVHHHLSTPCAPLASTSRFHRHGLYEMSSLCAMVRRLGNQRVVPCFRGLFFVGMSSSATPGNSSAACTQLLRRPRWPSTKIHSLGISHNPHPPIPMGTSDFGASLPFALVTTCRLARLPVGADQRFPSSQRRLLLPGFQRLDHSHRCRI
jgi:hypothetical protein